MKRAPHFVHVPDGSIVALALNDDDMAFVRDSGAKLRAQIAALEERLVSALVRAEAAEAALEQWREAHR